MSSVRLDKHIPIVTALDTILGSFGGTLRVMPFFSKAPLTAADGASCEV